VEGTLIITDLAEERAVAVADAIADIRTIDAAGITREGVERIRDRLLVLAEQSELFGRETFSAPGAGEKSKSILYRLSEDSDHRFALYLNACRDRAGAPPHDHTTWAVIVGLEGQERNVRYGEVAGGGAPTIAEEFMVERGTGIAFLPDDVHSIHIEGGALNFHCYGLGLERLHERRYWDSSTNEWKVFPAHTDIREARPGHDH
jgi:predicted metal-dependent enzyme (double-stranded beta helix superfamily)